MSELVLHRISYKELRERKYNKFDDPYGIVAFMTDHLRETLLACPNNKDESKTAMLLVSDNNVVVARCLMFGTIMSLNGDIYNVRTGGSMFVEEKYRSLGAGVDLLMAFTQDNEIMLASLLSTMVVPMYKKLKYIVFNIPQFAMIRSIKPVLYSVGIKGVMLDLCGSILNFPIRCVDIINHCRVKSILKNIVIHKEKIVPIWVDELTKCDKDMFMEIHDREWLQWNLDYNMNGYNGDIQSFYSIYDKTGSPVGFFMTKERFEERAGRYRNITRGTIVEWATSNPHLLSEFDINLLAVQTFSPRTFIINSVTTDNKVIRRLKRSGFFSHGYLQMSFFDRKKRFSNIDDISKWRIRYGCCNTIIYGMSPNEQ